MAVLHSNSSCNPSDVLTLLVRYVHSIWTLWVRVLTAGEALPLLLLDPAAASLQPAPAQNYLRQNVNPSSLYTAHNLSVPVDHFHNDSRYEPHSDAFFNLRYYFDASYYQPGGPVIVLQGGETSVAGRIPYLQKGIVAQLAQATGGIGVILEHRYYGTSFPTANLSTDSLRFLTTDQALADQAYFQNNVVFPGLENLNLTAPGTAYITYGGSYAGAFVSFMRKLYPESTWAAISSSGVTAAYYDFWQYFEPIRQYGPPDCISTHTKLLNIADNILLGTDNNTKAQLKTALNASSFTYDDDFANTLGTAMGGWQSRNWDPAVNSPTFERYCGNITSTSALYNVSSSTSEIEALISAGGWSNESARLTTAMTNYIGWYKTNIIESCETTLDSCYGAHNASSTKYTDKSVSNYDSLSWAYQYCTQWGYLQSGSTVPKNLLPLVSRLVSLEYNMLICNYGFNITTPAKVDEINKYGGYNFTYPRLATIGGQTDPWRVVSPLADQPLIGSTDIVNNTSTESEPIVVIEGAVHHWDENGLFPNETTPTLPPAPVRDAQATIIRAARVWMAQWRQWCLERPGVCNNLK